MWFSRGFMSSWYLWSCFPRKHVLSQGTERCLLCARVRWIVYRTECPFQDDICVWSRYDFGFYRYLFIKCFKLCRLHNCEGLLIGNYSLLVSQELERKGGWQDRWRSTVLDCGSCFSGWHLGMCPFRFLCVNAVPGRWGEMKVSLLAWKSALALWIKGG